MQHIDKLDKFAFISPFSCNFLVECWVQILCHLNIIVVPQICMNSNLLDQVQLHELSCAQTILWINL